MPKTAKPKNVKKKPAKKTTDRITVSVYAHKGKLVFFPSAVRKTKSFVPTEAGVTFGSVLCNADKKHLFISKEALELMRRVPRGRDAIGDISWWKCDDGSYAFAWFGATHRVMEIPSSLSDRDFKVSDDKPFTEIQNELPAEVLKEIAASNWKETGAWREPYGIGYEVSKPVKRAKKRR